MPTTPHPHQGAGSSASSRVTETFEGTRSQDLPLGDLLCLVWQPVTATLLIGQARDAWLFVPGPPEVHLLPQRPGQLGNLRIALGRAARRRPPLAFHPCPRLILPPPNSAAGQPAR